MDRRASLHLQLLLFVVLNCTDLFLTWRMLGQGNGLVYEGNPVARWWLDGLGWGGLMAFKLSSVLLFAGLAKAVFRRRPRTGARVVTFGCTTVAAVILYSCALPRLHGLEAEAAADEQIQAECDHLEAEMTRLRAYHALAQRLGPDVLAGRRTLAAAVGEVWQSGYWSDRTRLRLLGRMFPGYSPSECVTANFAEAMVDALRGQTEAARLARQLEGDFLAMHGRPLVWSWGFPFRSQS